MHIISSFSLLNKAGSRYIFIHHGVWVTHFVTLASYRHGSPASEGYNSRLRLSTTVFDVEFILHINVHPAITSCDPSEVDAKTFGVLPFPWSEPTISESVSIIAVGVSRKLFT